MPGSRRATTSAEQWDSLREQILKLYTTKTLDEVIQVLKDEHHFSVTKRQLVYRLSNWGCAKYGKAREGIPADKTGEETKETTYIDSNDPETHLETVPSSGVRFAPKSDHPSDALKYREITRLLVQYIHESMISGSVFVDLADHISRGHRLFKWATETDRIIDTIRLSHGYDSAVLLKPFRDKLEALDELIVDEYPHLLSTLLVVWKNTTQITDNAASSYFISKVHNLCQRLLGRQHVISEIFGCLRHGSFDPASCLERLEVLPSELYAHRSQALVPSFEKYETSDYHTASSLYSATDRNRGHRPGGTHPGLIPSSIFLAQRSKEDNKKYPWPQSPTGGWTKAAHEEPLTNKLAGVGTHLNLSARPLVAKSPPSSIPERLQSAKDNPDLLAVGSQYSLAAHADRIRTGNWKEEWSAAANTPPSENPNTPTQVDVDTRMVEDEQSMSNDEESDVSSTSTANEGQRVRAVEEEKRRTVQMVMDVFLRDLDRYVEEITSSLLEVKLEDESETRQVPSQAEGSTARTGNRTTRKRPKLCGEGGNGDKRKEKDRARDEDQGNESDEGEDDGERPRRVPDMKSEPKGVLLACPFFKWNPLGYQRKKECAGPGWPTVHRLKEHLFRRHGRLPFQCSRCRQYLKTQAKLDSHLRVAQLCEINTEADLSGEFKFGPDIERLLRVRSSPKLTVEEKWKQVYKILFDVREDEIPTPYYDYDISVLDREETLMEFARRDIVIRVRQHIEAEVEQRFADVAPELIAELRDIVRGVWPSLMQDFYRGQEQTSTIDREEALMRPPPPQVLNESSTNTVRTRGNDEGEMAVVPGDVPSTDNNLTEPFPLDYSQQESYPAWTEASGLSTLNHEIAEGEQLFDSALLGDDFDFEFLNDDGGNGAL
ncbi:hypothetical protein CLIM01_05961 [Colletotrichum limetticola]|uniref:Clr5 domain-containing protein n=1 Tax=Colletotrichum limetticola TaxID=1209924 RepID=A0ABQ9PYS3_9PEZI|nr:hypothetical protein CLIM01_05961 [Colletotrichum limetticola]